MKPHKIVAETYLGPGGGYRCAICHQGLRVNRTNGKSNRHYTHLKGAENRKDQDSFGVSRY